MSDRRNRPPNRWGCKPTEDVCVQHDRPLVCRHGCDEGTRILKPGTRLAGHSCKDFRMYGQLDDSWAARPEKG
jgi:hypothetical protein